ncbi:MAG: hypothetical protein L6R36_007584, partial [Xanthoria steineri]
PKALFRIPHLTQPNLVKDLYNALPKDNIVMSFRTGTTTGSRMIQMMGITSATARPAVMHPTLGKRPRDTETDDDLMMLSSPSKRMMPMDPTTPRRSPHGRRPQWDVDRYSPRHQIFKTQSASLDNNGKFARWQELIPAALELSSYPPVSRGLDTLTASQNAGAPSESRPIRRAVSPRARLTMPRSHPAELQVCRPERRETDSSAASPASKKRSAEEALDGAMPDAPEDFNLASPQPTKRQRSTSSGFSLVGTGSSSSNPSSARRTISSSSSARRNISSSSSVRTPAKLPTFPLKFPPTIKETEKREFQKRRPSPKGTCVIKGSQLLDDADQGDAIWNGLWHSFFPERSGAQLPRKLDWTSSKVVLPIRAKVVEAEEEDWTSANYTLPIRAKAVVEEEDDGEGEIL